MTSKALQWVSENPDYQSDRGTLPQTNSKSGARRPHRKSRDGCNSCKHKRIKCDELKPECQQCVQRRIACVYRGPDQSSASMMTSLAVQNSMSRDVARREINQFMQENNIPCDRMEHAKYKRIDALELIDHWYETKEAWIGTTECQRIMQEAALEVALSPKTPYFLHGILAISACHLCYLYPGQTKWGIASNLHYSQAVSLYLRQLRTDISSENANRILGCCLLLEMMVVWYMSRPPSDSPPLDLVGDFTGLRSIRGVSVLQSSPELRSHLRESIWQPVFLEFDPDAEDSQTMAEGSPLSNSSALEALELLCGVDCSSSLEFNVYKLPLKRLKGLILVEQSRDTIGWFIQWIACLPSDFIQLLEAKDHRALLILSYWSAHFLHIDQWWIEQTARVQCLQICEYLEETSDLTIKALLEFPSKSCLAGKISQHQQQ